MSKIIAKKLRDGSKVGARLGGVTVQFGRDGLQGPEGLGVFVTTQLLNSSGTGITSPVNPAVPTGRSVKVGDLIVSSNASSPGVFGQVTDITPQGVISVTYKGSWRGAVGPQGATGATGSTGATGAKGEKGDEGLGIWATTSQLNSNSTTSGVQCIAQADRSVKLGDLVVSSHVNSSGAFGKVTGISTQNSVTVTYLGSIRGEKGETGAKGNTGAQGPQGPPLKAVGYIVNEDINIWRGTAVQLPASRQTGTLYFVRAT